MAGSTSHAKIWRRRVAPVHPERAVAGRERQQAVPDPVLLVARRRVHPRRHGHQRRRPACSNRPLSLTVHKLPDEFGAMRAAYGIVTGRSQNAGLALQIAREATQGLVIMLQSIMLGQVKGGGIAHLTLMLLAYSRASPAETPSPTRLLTPSRRCARSSSAHSSAVGFGPTPGAAPVASAPDSGPRSPPSAEFPVAAEVGTPGMPPFKLQAAFRKCNHREVQLTPGNRHGITGGSRRSHQQPALAPQRPAP